MPNTALSRTSVAMAALMIAVASAIGVGVMIASFRDAVTRWLEGTLRADVYISAPSLVGSRPDATLDPQFVARLAATPGVRRSFTVTRANVSSVEVCYRPDASVLRLHDVSGSELSRSARSGDAHLAFDAIVASVRPPFNHALGVRMPTTQIVTP